ncbi:kinase-like protein [Sistotremastrum suecicum HHB10207 ss-3]|uniref:Kinase-like protein n=1 Tax=Sistotremastrum suecicum HHB10207 ss-3 TaxID=1314776 RepID=A0A166D6K7_9AGAM|nr:kinase-like protein [Sistotremastrum suecicum HHB10207 ss-3]
MGGLCSRAEPLDFDGEVDLFHFALLQNIGKGAFGKVRIVQHKQTQEIYALKYIHKATCIKKKAVSNIISERRLLEQIDHPLLVNMRYAFQDDENCFYVLDLMLGGDLRFHLDRHPNGSFAETEVMFMVAELSCGLAYLHDQRIIHRDIKPDNVLLDEAGHAHITDFNIARHYSDRKLLKGIAGSAPYMAPELFSGAGYTYTPDWWSLGVVAYELLFGIRPHRERTQMDLLHAISNTDVQFPDGAGRRCTPEGLNAISSFLNRDPRERLGCVPYGNGFSTVQQHPWFANIDWPRLERKEIIPPFTPGNKANFDPTHNLEEMLLESNPLRARARKSNAAPLSPDMAELETGFTVYDFKRMPRRAIVPQQTVSTMTGTSTEPVSSRPETPEQVDFSGIPNGHGHNGMEMKEARGNPDMYMRPGPQIHDS